MTDDPRLDDLDIQVITVTLEDDGNITYDHTGMSEQQAVWMLHSALHMVQHDYWYGATDDDDE